MAALTPDDRAFFDGVSHAMFANPFGTERHERDGWLAQMDHDPERRGEILGQICLAIATRLHTLGLGTTRTLSDHSAADQRLVLTGLLFLSYHSWWSEWGDLLERQRGVAEPVDATFCHMIVEGLVRWGVREAHAVRYVGMFHQIYRAYALIGSELTGQSPSMRALRERLWVNVFTHDLELYFDALWDNLHDFSTFLTGATGTGKSSAARALGRSGWIAFDPKRKRFAHSFEALFVPVNLSQYPASLIESALFGHVKGAFTGAIQDHEGVLGRCMPHGVLFIDEIGEVAQHVQVKLLNVLQERVYVPVGGHTPRRFEGRVVAATNRPMAELRGPDGLRDDFYYRLCSDILEVPSLHERLVEDPEDLERLAREVLVRMLGEGATAARLERVVGVVREELGVGHAWPGNVRELEQAVRQVVLTGHVYAPRVAPVEEAGPDAPLDEVIARACLERYTRLGSYEAAAESLGVDRRTVSKYVRLAKRGF